MLNLRKDDSISSKGVRTQTEQFLKLFNRTLNSLHLKDVKISLYIIVLIVRGRFDRTQGLVYFSTWCARFAFAKLSRICSCILLIRNHMIFLVQFGLNKPLLIFSKITNCTRLTGSCNFVSIWKMYSCLFIPSCTRNHVITSTNIQMFMK